MEHSNSMENLHFQMSTGNVRNLARLFEDNSVARKPNFVLTRSKSKSSSNVVIKKDVKEIVERETLSFRDIHSKFESGIVAKKSIQRMSSVNSLECLKLQEIKEISRRTDDIVKKVKNSDKVGSGFYITYLNDIVEMLLKIGQIETNGNTAIQTEKLATLQVLQKCYSQLRGKLENFLVEENSEEEEEQKMSIRSSIQKWESMIDTKSQYETPNYSTHFITQRNEAKSHETITTEIIKYTDIEDDIKMVEHVKVQNLKNIWERRASQDEYNEDNHPVQQPQEIFQTEEIVLQTEQQREVRIQQESKFQSEEKYQFEVENEKVSIEEIPLEEENKNSSPIETEDNKKVIVSELKFLKNERKHTDDTYTEKELIESHVTVEYLLEPEVIEDNPQIIEEVTNTTIEVNEDGIVDEEPAREIKAIDDEPIHEVNNAEERIEEIKDTNVITPDIKETIGDQLISLEEEIKTVAEEKDIPSTSDGDKDIVSSTIDFLNEERKNSDFQLEDIDPKFGPPTGIIPDPNQNYEPVEIKDEKPADDQFIIIYEKQESTKENLYEESNECSLKGENVQHMVVQETIYREGDYLLLDNRSVEEIQEATRSKEEVILVNGDKI